MLSKLVCHSNNTSHVGYPAYLMALPMPTCCAGLHKYISVALTHLSLTVFVKTVAWLALYCFKLSLDLDHLVPICDCCRTCDRLLPSMSQ